MPKPPFDPTDPSSWPAQPFPGDPEGMLRAINENSNRLIAEFYEHLKEVRESSPGIGQREVYEGWMIQKVSGLQVLLMALNERLNALGDELARVARRR